MGKVIPNIKVSYNIKDILLAFFISSRQKKYNNNVEEYLENLLNVRSVFLTSSGRSALYFVLSYLPQKKVIVPAYTCDVVIEAATLAGKEIVFAHVDRETLNISELPEIDSGTIVIATHQYGYPCDIKNICAICKQKGAIVIEDCAGAFGTKIEGQMVGTFGDYAIFSFNASKLINSPASGGFLIAKEGKDMKALKERITLKKCTCKYKIKSLSKGLAMCLDKNAFFHYWLSKKTRHDAAKAHISAESYHPPKDVVDSYFNGFYNWQAYVVLKQLKRLPYLMRKRGELKKAYQTLLNVEYQKETFDRQNCSIRYPIYLKDRDDFRKRVRTKGIEIGYGFEHSVCPEDYKDEICIAREITYLPYSSNYTKKEISKIVKVLNQVSNEQSISS